MKHIFFIFIYITFLSALFACSSKFRSEQFPNVKDSIAIRRFIEKNDFCRQLRFMEKNKTSLYDNTCYSYMIPGNISIKAGLNLRVIVATGDMFLSDELRNADIQDQIDSFKRKLGCKY
jgi:hypothetical protein